MLINSLILSELGGMKAIDTEITVFYMVYVP